MQNSGQSFQTARGSLRSPTDLNLGDAEIGGVLEYQCFITNFFRDFRPAVCRAFRCLAGMPFKPKPFDADRLTSPELINGYLDEAIATGNAAVIRLALRVIARARSRATAALRTDPAPG